MSGESKLLDAEFIQKLERLSIGAKRVFPGRQKGEKRSPRQGSSLEFADYREYAPGDDLRYVDWKAYARLEKLFVKLFVEEEDLAVHILIDASQSMLYPTENPSGTVKFDFARKIAAALGYVALSRYDRLGVAAFSQALGGRPPALNDKASAPQLFSYLESLQAGGRTDFVTSLRNYAMRHTSPGVCVILSDFYDPNWEKGVRALLSRRYQIVLIQILAPEEIKPEISGDIRLVDAETGESREVSITPAVLASYQDALRHFCTGLSDLASRQGMDYLCVTTDTPLEDVLLKSLRESGLLKG